MQSMGLRWEPMALVNLANKLQFDIIRQLTLFISLERQQEDFVSLFYINTCRYFASRLTLVPVPPRQRTRNFGH